MLKNLIPQDQFDIVGRIQGDKASFMIDLIVSKNLTKCVEIGVWKGSSLFTIAEGVKQINGHVTGIDPWAMDQLHNDIPQNPALSKHIIENIIKEQATLDTIYKQLVDTIQKNELERFITIIRNTSTEACNHFYDNSLDLLHIDGNHDEINVSNDIMNYISKVKKHGYFILDDTNWPGVYSAYEKHLKPYVSVVHFGNIWSCFQKN